MKTIFSTAPFSIDLGILLLRIIFGGMFIFNGYMKIESYDEFLPMFQEILGLGAKTEFNLLIFAEFFCGIFVTLGFVTRLSVLPICFAMGVAYFVAHKNEQFAMKQLPFVYMLLPLVIILLGAGKYSLDHLLFKKKTIPGAGE